MPINPVLYVVYLNERCLGIVATPHGYLETDVSFREDIILRIMVTMGFKSLSEYQNILPGHSENDIYEESDLSDPKLSYNFLGNDKNSHELKFSFSRFPVYSEQALDHLNVALFGTRGFISDRFLIQPTVNELKECFQDYTYIKDKFIWYCSDWKDNASIRLQKHRRYKLFLSNILPAICTKSGYFAIVFTTMQLYSFLKGHSDSIMLSGVVIFFTLMLWCNVIEMAYKGKADPKEEPLFSFKRP